MEHQRRPSGASRPVLTSFEDQAQQKAAEDAGAVQADLTVVHSSLIVLDILLEEQFCSTFYNV